MVTGTNPTAMTTFDEREEAFEKKFMPDEELRFKALARRNRLTALWAAAKLGLSGEAAIAYSREVVAAEFDEGGDAAVVAKMMRDLAAKGAIDQHAAHAGGAFREA